MCSRELPAQNAESQTRQSVVTLSADPPSYLHEGKNRVKAGVEYGSVPFQNSIKPHPDLNISMLENAGSDYNLSKAVPD